MLKKIPYTLFIAVAFLFCSCEKVINIDTADGSGKVVIEGVVTNETGTCKVLVSTTRQFSDNNDFAGISGAQVTISEEGGGSISLTETAPGVYESASFKGTPGKTYKMQVTRGAQVFTAESTMPIPVPLDTAFATEETLFGDTRLLVQVEYKDPSGTGNNYRFIQYVNGVKEKQLFFRSDSYSDGNDVRFVLRFDTDDDDNKNLKSNDQILIQMLCIDAAVHKYWYSLDQGATGENQSAAPSNPVTNIKGGALGYFSAHSIENRSFRIP